VIAGMDAAAGTIDREIAHLVRREALPCA